MVRRAHPQVGVDWTAIKQTGEATGDAGDQYTGLDRFGRIVDQRWLVTANGTHTDRFAYGYDRDGNRLYRDNKVNSAFGELYHSNGTSAGYDLLNQLSAFARGTLGDSNGDGIPDAIATPSRSQSWVLDALGNWTSLTSDGTAVSRTHNQQNEVTAVGATALTFDKNGNTTQDETSKTFVYDAWNRLVQVKSGSTVLVSYTYDALGRRITETAGTTTTDLFFSAAWQVVEEQVGGVARVQYVWSPGAADTLVERDRDADGNPANGLEERLYVQQDAVGNVTALVGAAGAVLERYTYDPYGAVTVRNASWAVLGASAYASIYLYQAGRSDSHSGLYNFRNRDYSPTLGWWLEVDPAGYGAGDNNLYRDVHNRPTSATDSSGLKEADDRTTKYTKDLVDVGAKLEAHVNAVIGEARQKYPPGAANAGEAITRYVYEQLGTNRPGTGVTLASVSQITEAEYWLGANLDPNKKEMYQYTFRSSRYGDTKVGFPSLYPSLISINTANHSIAPTVRANETLMGTDKWGHFFQQGYWYFDNRLTIDEKLDFGLWMEGDQIVYGTPPKPWNMFAANNFTIKMAKIDLKWTAMGEKYNPGRFFGFGYFGAASTGVVSYADISANAYGSAFYKDLYDDPYAYVFRISSVPTYKFNEIANPN